MPSPSDQHRLEFRFKHAADDTPRVPSSILIQSLQGTQRALWLIAMSKQNLLRTRARIPASIEQAFQLQCEVPKSGSYVMPAVVSPSQPFLEGLGNWTSVVEDFEHIAEGLTSGSREIVQQLLPDASFRRRIIDCFRSMAPRAGSGWRLELASTAHTFTFHDSFQTLLRKAFQEEAAETSTQVVNGELTRIDFGGHKISMIVLGSDIEVECRYEELLEDFLYQKRRDKIQVTGRVIRNEHGLIKQMIDVESITELDLSPIELTRFEASGRGWRFNQPLLLTPALDPDTMQHIVLECPKLGIHVFASTVPLLMEELTQQFAALWTGYAEYPDDQLTPKALDLKRALVASVHQEPA